MEKRSSEEEMDMTEACTDKPVQEQVSSSFSAYGLACTFLIFYRTVFYSTGDPRLLFNSHGNQKHGSKRGEFMLSFKIITISLCTWECIPVPSALVYNQDVEGSYLSTWRVAFGWCYLR